VKFLAGWQPVAEASGGLGGRSTAGNGCGENYWLSGQKLSSNLAISQ